jgi:hypothetical protein
MEITTIIGGGESNGGEGIKIGLNCIRWIKFSY